MLTQSVRRVQPGKRTFSISAKPADPLESKLWLELGRVTKGLFTELGHDVRVPWKPTFTRHLAYISVQEEGT